MSTRRSAPSAIIKTVMNANSQENAKRRGSLRVARARADKAEHANARRTPSTRRPRTSPRARQLFSNLLAFAALTASSLGVVRRGRTGARAGAGGRRRGRGARLRPPAGAFIVVPPGAGWLVPPDCGRRCWAGAASSAARPGAHGSRRSTRRSLTLICIAYGGMLLLPFEIVAKS